MSHSELDLVSVIVPVYRTEEYLNDCMRSILNQTYSRLEVILVDDGSDDRSPELCDQWAEADPRVRVIHQINQGLSAARNRGLDEARGAFVTFVDSDDIIASTFIHHLHLLARSRGADIVVARGINFWGGSPLFDPSSEFRWGSGRKILVDLIRDGRNWEVWGRLYDRQLFLAGLRFQDGLLYEDLEFTPRAFTLAETVVLSAAQLYGYRQRVDSIMGQSRIRTSPDLLLVLSSNIRLARRVYGDSSPEYRKLLTVFFLHAAKQIETMGRMDSLAGNSLFVDEYVSFMRKNFREFVFLPEITRAYRGMMALSAFSPRTFIMVFRIAERLKRFVPRLRRASLGPSRLRG